MYHFLNVTADTKKKTLIFVYGIELIYLNYWINVFDLPHFKKNFVN